MSLVSYTGSRHRDSDGGRGFSSLMDGGKGFGSLIGERGVMSNGFSPRSNKRSLQVNDFFNDDQSFGSSRGIFGQMDSLMGSMMRDPFAEDPFFRGGNSFPGLSLMAPPHHNEARVPQMAHRDPFAMSPFGSLMQSMETMSREGSCHSFSSSSVMTMTTGPDGRPQKALGMQKTDANSCRWQEKASRATQVYQASSSSRHAPGGVQETHRSVADSSTGVRKMAIGHHINDRSHVIEKEMGRDGDLEERQEFVNLDEEEAPDFDREFRQRTQQGFGALEGRPRYRSDGVSSSSPSRHRSTYLSALPATSRMSLESSRRRSRPMMAITSGARY